MTKPTETAKRVVAYLRVSTPDQVQGDGLDRQEDAVRRFCEHHGWVLLRIFAERGISGTELEGRVAFWEMLEWIRTSQHDTVAPPSAVVVESLDRLARDVLVAEIILAELRKVRVELYATNCGPVDLLSAEVTDPTRKLIRQILSAVAEWEKSIILARTIAAKRRTGRLGGRPLWWKSPRNRLLVYSLRQLDKLGFTHQQMATMLNEQGILTPQGCNWTSSRIHYWLERVKELPRIQEELNQYDDAFRNIQITTDTLSEALACVQEWAAKLGSDKTNGSKDNEADE